MKRTYLKHGLQLALSLTTALSASTAFAQYYREQYIEAECPNTSTGAYGTRQTSVTGYSGSGYIRSVGNITATDFNNTSADHATYSFNVREGGYYRLWIRLNTNNSAADDSFFFRLDNTSWWINMNAIPAGSGWRWVQGTAIFPIGPGAHQLEIANREDGLNIDKFVLLHDGDPAPSGAGEAGYNCAVPLYFESECRTSAFGAYQLDKKAKTGASGTGYLESPNNSTTDPNASSDQVTYYFESGASAYNFFFRINNNANASNDSFYYRVDGGSWVTINNTNTLGSGWRWAQGTASVTLARGVHTLEVRNREAGLSLDKLAFVPTSVTGPSGTGIGSTAVNCEPHTTMSDWSSPEVQQYYQTHLNYITVNGAHMLEAHVEWHQVNGSGGTAGKGSGVAFFGFHRAMVNDFRKFALETNGRSWLPIKTTGQIIPPTLFDAYNALEAVNLLDQYYPRISEVVADAGLPRYLSLGGVPDAQWPSSYTAGGVTYNKLEDFADLDTLGQAVAANNYHASVHINVAGTMSSFYSPADPIFFGWHGLIDKIAERWLATAKGQQWAAANPSHPFLVPGFTNHHGWDNTDFD